MISTLKQKTTKEPQQPQVAVAKQEPADYLPGEEELKAVLEGIREVKSPKE